MKGHDMSDDLVRRKVFWLLQRLTSYSLWQKKAEAWQVFADAYEHAVKTWPEDDPQRMNADNLVRIYEMLSWFEQGLAELRNGRRHVWRTAQPFRQVIDNYTTLTKYFFTHPAYWERGMQAAPYPPKVETLSRLMRASEYLGDDSACEVPYREDSWARWTSPGGLLNPDAYRFEFQELAYPVFPDVLPEVPASSGLIVHSGQAVPVDGIWEPVRNEPTKVLGLIPLGGKKTESAGCFNYLVKDTVAPNLLDSSQDMSNGIKTLDVDWRLIWEDTRYRDGIARDESVYFLRPRLGESRTKESDVAVELMTSAICPVSGLWVAVGYDAPPVTIIEGSVMPDLVIDRGQGERRVYWVTWRLQKRL